MNKEALVTLSLGEIDNMLFTQMTTRMQEIYPSDHRHALKVAMRVVDVAMEEFEALAKRQQKSGLAKQAAAARWAPGSEATNQAQAAQAIVPPAATDSAAPVPANPSKKRVRRTKAQIAADEAARLAGNAAERATKQAEAPQPVPMGAPFAEPFTPPAAPAAFGGGMIPTPPPPPGIAVPDAPGSTTPPPPLMIPTFGAQP